MTLSGCVFVCGKMVKNKTRQNCQLPGILAAAQMLCVCVHVCLRQSLSKEDGQRVHRLLLI